MIYRRKRLHRDRRNHSNPCRTQEEPLKKVLFDTDIGSDIDDAVALAWLLANDDCDLVGITTVSGQPVERAKLASVLCEVSEQDIPILRAPQIRLRLSHDNQ